MRLQSTRPSPGRQLPEQLIDEAAATLRLAVRLVPPREREAWLAQTQRELAGIINKRRDQR